MSRIIKTDSSGKQRNRLLRAIVISIRALMRQNSVTSETKDLAAFISNALISVHETIEETVVPWEKRGYWVKADRFRLEWEWTKQAGEEMLAATKDGDWVEVAAQAAKVGIKLQKIQVSDKHRMGKPWVGAWSKMIGDNK